MDKMTLTLGRLDSVELRMTEGRETPTAGVVLSLKVRTLDTSFLRLVQEFQEGVPYSILAAPLQGRLWNPEVVPHEEQTDGAHAEMTLQLDPGGPGEEKSSTAERAVTRSSRRPHKRGGRK